jgi:predicted permease
LEVLFFSLGITLPIFIVLCTGTILRRNRLIDDNFIGKASKISFNIALPALLFISILKSDIDIRQGFSLTIYGILATTALFVLLEIFMPLIVKDKRDRGVMVQGAFRSNLGIVGLAYCINAYGDGVYGLASMYVAFNTILYNILGVITLSRWSDSANSGGRLLMPLISSIAKNPIVVAIVIALGIKFVGVSLPETVVQAGTYFAQLALPLALLCAGASLNFSNRSDLTLTLVATLFRLILFPGLITLGGALFGYRGMELGVLFLMTSAPAAAASYIMARAIGGNAELAGNIIAVTTFFSLLSTGLGAAMLRYFGLN